MKIGRHAAAESAAMEQQLLELLDRCATVAATADANDTGVLAQLHDDLTSVRMLTFDSPRLAAGKTSERFAQSTEHAASLVEKLVLRDVQDAGASLAQVRSEVAELQAMLHEAGRSPPGTTGAVSAPSDGAERVIRDEDATMALEFVGEAIGHLEAIEASLLKLGIDPTDAGELNIVLRTFHTIKGMAGFLHLKQIGALAHATETLLDLCRKGKLRLVEGRLDVLLAARDMARQMVAAVETAAKQRGPVAGPEGLDRLLLRLEEAASGREMTPEAPAEEEQPSPQSNSDPSAENGAAFVRVATARLDTLIDAVGELVIAQSMVSQDLAGGATLSDQRLSRNLAQLGKVTRGLQDLSTSLRMVPITGVFQKMARLARDVARKSGKDVEFTPIGGDTELDRNIVDAISDPLMHMVRNAIDHGLESTEERIAAGKALPGRLTLRAFHLSGNIVIEVADDGRGLDQQKILKKANAAGLVKEGQALTTQEIFQLIFHPGLTTAEQVTDLSGRGIGMDVVRKNVEALRGRIDIASTPGNGSTFTVRLPLTLAIIDGLIVKVGGHRYIIPVTGIERSLRPLATQLSTVAGRGEMCMVRQSLLPIVRLHRLFDIQPRCEDPTAALIVIIQDGLRRCCLLVDELVGRQQVVIKAVGREIGRPAGIAGCAILGDGNVGLILDVAGIIHTALD
jgi:two-component system chemotaxis sensor kinase CheA